jgi:8-oxo-dGTP diphosphatase
MTRLVVGAVIVHDGRAFVHRRGSERRLFPNCWDIPGSHVDSDETPLDALRRELEEETGWKLRRVLSELGEIAWTGSDGERRREIDYLVEVEGDLGSPRLEHPKNVEFAWIGLDELDRLMENRTPEQTLLRDIVARGLQEAARNRGFRAAIRPRSEHDLDRCVQLLETVHQSDAYPTFWPDDPVKWLSPRGMLGAWVADEDGRIVGHIDLRAAEADAGAAVWSRATGLPPERLAAIGRLFVSPGRRGRGVGDSLLDAACQAAATQGRHPVLDVVETDANAIRLYERRGWRRAFSEPWAAADGRTVIHYYVAPDAPAS